MHARVSPEVAELRIDLDATLPRSSPAIWGILAVSLDRGDTLYSRNPDLALQPASNMKLVTTAAALYHLGADFRFRTLVLTSAPVVDGILRGDLVLYGTGDPALSDRFHGSMDAAFEALAAQLVEAGITGVEGDVVGDPSYFEGPLLGPSWDPSDLNEWFAAPVSGLSYNENLVTLEIVPSSSGVAPPVVHEDPAGAELVYDNNARTVPGSPRPRLWLERLQPDAVVRLEGEMNRRGPSIWRRLTVADPARFATRGFRSVLEAAGIDVEGETRVLDDGHANLVNAPRRSHTSTMRVVAELESPPLFEYLEVVNHVSHNLFAEAVFKTLGKVVGGDGSFAGGAQVMRDFLSAAGVPPGSVQALDGSGLSVGNSFSAGAFVRLIETMARSAQWTDFENTLPLAGTRRGLRRMYRTAAASNLRAKTGTIEGVSALTGVVRARSGERIAFSIIANGVRSESSAKRIEDRIGARLAEFDRPEAQVAPGGR